MTKHAQFAYAAMCASMLCGCHAGNQAQVREAAAPRVMSDAHADFTPVPVPPATRSFVPLLILTKYQYDKLPGGGELVEAPQIYPYLAAYGDAGWLRGLSDERPVHAAGSQMPTRPASPFELRVKDVFAVFYSNRRGQAHYRTYDPLEERDRKIATYIRELRDRRFAATVRDSDNIDGSHAHVLTPVREPVQVEPPGQVAGRAGTTRPPAATTMTSQPAVRSLGSRKLATEQNPYIRSLVKPWTKPGTLIDDRER
jgi:hypothetical protein